MSKEMCMPGLDDRLVCVDHDPQPRAPSGPRPALVGLSSRHVELDEQIVGSSHAFPIGELALEHAGMAQVTIEVRPSPDRTSAFQSRLGLDPAATLRARATAFSSDHRAMIPITNQPAGRVRRDGKARRVTDRPRPQGASPRAREPLLL